MAWLKKTVFTGEQSIRMNVGAYNDIKAFNSVKQQVKKNQPVMDLIIPVMASFRICLLILSETPLFTMLIEISPCTTDQKV